MRGTAFLRLLGLVWLLAGAAYLRGWAEPSLSLSDRVEVSLLRGARSLTVLRDAEDRAHWYYLPDRVRLVERRQNGEREPEFSLVTYPTRDPANPDAWTEAGILHFSVTLAVPPEVVAQAREEIRKTQPGDIRLSPLSLKSSEVSCYAPGTGRRVMPAAPRNSPGPIFADEKVAFSLRLERLDARFVDRLTAGKIGVPVVVAYRYTGRLPSGRVEERGESVSGQIGIGSYPAAVRARLIRRLRPPAR